MRTKMTKPETQGITQKIERTFVENCSEECLRRIGRASPRCGRRLGGGRPTGRPPPILQPHRGDANQHNPKKRKFDTESVTTLPQWTRCLADAGERERERERERPPEALGRGSGCGGMGAQNHEMVRDFSYFLKNAPGMRIWNFGRICVSPTLRSGPCHYFNGVAGAIA